MRDITQLEIAAAVKTLSATARGRALLGILTEMVDEPHVPAATHETRCAIMLLAAQCRGQGNTVREAIAPAFGGNAAAVLYSAENAEAERY